MYDFRKQLTSGEDYEKILDAYYSRWYKVQEISMDSQKSGIDRVWTDRETGMRTSIEYKTDFIAPTTGNVFIETMSVDVENKLGWAYTSCAQWLVYYIPGMKRAYRITMLNVKHYLPFWENRYEKKKVPNNGYYTEGILVPLDEFEKRCNKKDEGVA